MDIDYTYFYKQKLLMKSFVSLLWAKTYDKNNIYWDLMFIYILFYSGGVLGYDHYDPTANFAISRVFTSIINSQNATELK